MRVIITKDKRKREWIVFFNSHRVYTGTLEDCITYKHALLVDWLSDWAQKEQGDENQDEFENWRPNHRPPFLVSPKLSPGATHENQNERKSGAEASTAANTPFSLILRNER